MNKTELFNKIIGDLKNKLHFLEDKPDENLETTVKALWFAAAGIPVSATGVIKQKIPELAENQINNLYRLIGRRLNNTPLAYLTKRQNFMGLELLSDERALIPRKETEILGNRALDLSREISKSNPTVKVIDVGCGSGNLGLAIAHLNPDCLVYLTDISQDAVNLTQENIDLHKLNKSVRVFQGDLLSGFETGKFYGKIDLIVCNPPYILSSNVPKMDPEISLNEPVLAFDGGMLGIKIIQKLISEAPKFLTPKGWLIFEVGLGQGPFMANLIERTHLYGKIKSLPDDAGNIRVIQAQILKKVNS